MRVMINLWQLIGESKNYSEYMHEKRERKKGWRNNWDTQTYVITAILQSTASCITHTKSLKTGYKWGYQLLVIVYSLVHNGGGSNEC